MVIGVICACARVWDWCQSVANVIGVSSSHLRP
nr:MAG TPA: hypothetical protein [Caudoviricetes sp.]